MSPGKSFYTALLGSALAIQPSYAQNKHEHTRAFYESILTLDALQNELDSCEPGPVEAWGHVEKAYRLQKQGDHKGAITPLREAINQNPKHRMAYQNLSTAYLKVKDYIACKQFAKRAFELCEGDATLECKALSNLCISSVNLKDFQAAQMYWEKWQALAPKDELLIKIQPKVFPRN
ncbi:hypothetical protein HY641_03530 [Candidatus Woesearchaeota archaeon]|nr:hypothetical protein [Candidatus Woesearchaeota archaeon]